MKDPNDAEEVAKILQESPSARQALLENYTNLYNVADYCEKNYLEAGDESQKALEETKAFTTQSLASVAYQISNLASSVLKLLDAQTAQLCQIESSVNLIGQTVEMHREKVARREIGVFTTSKRVPRGHKVIPPATGKEPKAKYSRTPISYASLDSLGHGMKEPGKQVARTATMTRKPGGTLGRNSRPPEPVQCPVVPTLSHGASVTSLTDRSTGSSFGKAVSPPVVPSWPAEPDIINTLLEDTPPPPPPPTDGEVPIQDQDLIPPPPHLPGSETLGPPTAPPPPPPPPPPPLEAALPPPPPAPPLETVTEENGFPPPIAMDEAPPSPITESSADLPSPPPIPPLDDLEAARSRRSRVRRHPPSARSLSLRVRMGPSMRSLYTRSLFLPGVQSLMIPPPPPYPPPLAPPAILSPLTKLPASLEHLDLEIPAPPPPPLDCFDGFDDMPPLPPPVDYDTSAPTDYLEKVVALYDYDTGKSDDLVFQAGDMIYVTSKNEEDWWQGERNGVQGYFPNNYVRPAD